MENKKTKTKMTIKIGKSGHKVLSVTEAEKKPVGSFYHPTKKTIRRGRCPLGEVMREGYTKKSGTKVKPECVKNKGLPGKVTEEAKVLPKLKKGQLTKYGYHLHESSDKRFEALMKAMKVYGYASLIRHLVPLRSYFKEEPDKYKIVNNDIKKLQKWHANHPEQS